MTDQIIRHTSRFAWSGGADEDVGIKRIDHKGTINLVTLNERALAFVMAKGEQDAVIRVGQFTLNMELYREIEDN